MAIVDSESCVAILDSCLSVLVVLLVCFCFVLYKNSCSALMSSYSRGLVGDGDCHFASPELLFKPFDIGEQGAEDTPGNPI